MTHPNRLADLIARPITPMDPEREQMFKESNDRLFSLLPQDQVNRVFSYYRCDIDPDFLGFVDIYERLSQIIPTSRTVIDLGCSFGAQAFFFAHHKAYIGVDLLVPTAARFVTANAKHFEMTIEEFISRHASSYDRQETFAICSYVPPWHGDNGAMVRARFKHCFVFYP